MMKRDLKSFKYVAGEKVENKPYENKFNKTQNYRYRDINQVRLPKWDLIQKFSKRDDINSKYHQESHSHIVRFRPSRKNFDQSMNQHQVQNQQDPIKPSLRQVYHAETSINKPLFPTRIRQIPEISDELKIMNEKQLLPHMRSITPNGRPINVKHCSEFRNTEELDIINQMHYVLPHMRTKTPTGRPISNPVTHILSNETDFINQKKYLLPSMQNILPQTRQCLTERNRSQFTLSWDA